MTVLYRALWSAPTDSADQEVLSKLALVAAGWIQESREPVPMEEGVTEWNVSQRRVRRALVRTLDSQRFAIEVRDQIQGDTTEWGTTIKVVVHEGEAHVLVENSMVSDDFTLRVAVGRPRVVHDLLVATSNPTLGNSAVLTEPQAIPAEAISVLLDHLGDSDRALPVIVCTEPLGGHEGTWLRNSVKLAARTEGAANVVTLDRLAARAFRERLGDLAIWGGGVRTYAPGAVTIDSDGWRHRFFLRSRMEEAERATIDRIVYAVAALSARRRVPLRFAFVDGGAERTGAQPSISTADFEVAREEWAFELELAIEERSDVEKELARSTGHLARLKDELKSRGLADLLWGTEHDHSAGVPDEVQDTSEAVLAAQTYLSVWLAVPEGAARELQDIDTAPTAYAWGNNTWRGLRALAAYAADRADGWSRGGFWEWCASGPVLGWPATSKKLSMTESETVKNNDKLARTRQFVVDPLVHADGVVQMLAHLKISEGGGNLAPRVYFYDDTAGATGKVHVGLVGPHYLVPNKSTN